MAKITEDGLKALLDAEIAQALGYVGKLTVQRQKAIYYYNAEAKLELAPPEVDGRSSVVSSDVSDVVEWIMPQLCKIFTGSDDAVSFAATNEQGEAAAEQATAYCNHVFYRQNRGFTILHNWFKDALIEKTGIVKVWWDEHEDVTREEYKGLTIPEIATFILNDKTVQIVEASPSQDPHGGPAPLQEPQPQAAPQAPGNAPANPTAPPGAIPGNAGVAPSSPGEMPGPMPAAPGGAVSTPSPLTEQRYDIVLKRTKDASKVCIENVPPEEFLLSRRARTMDEPFFCAHRVRTNPSKLKSMGYTTEQIKNCTSDGTWEANNQEAVERRAFDDSSPVDQNEGVGDPTLRDIWMHECYVNVDFDGDGIAELRKITKCGTEILDNDPVDDHPFALLTPILMPHRVVGRSVSDLVFDIQRIKTVLLRQYLDSGYLSQTPRMYVDTTKGVNLDDLLTVRPGGVIRGNGPGGVEPLLVPHTGQQALEGLQMMDDVRESRTGVSKYKNITNPESLNKSATEVNAASDASNQRIELIARVFAETGVQDLFRKIQKLGSQNAQQALTLRINGKWQPVDPREWKTQFDVSINVGLGSGNKEQAVQHMMALGQAQQAGAQIGIVKPKNFYNTAIELTKAMGIKDTDRFWIDPGDGPAPQPPPSPEIAVAQIKAQTELQIASQKGQQDAQIRQQEVQATQATEQARAQADVAIEQHKANVKSQVDAQHLQNQLILEEAKHAKEIQADIMKAYISAIAMVESARIKQGDDDGQGMVSEMAGKAGLSAGGLGPEHFQQMMDEFRNAVTAPKQIVRDGTGRAVGVQTVQQQRPSA